MVAREAEDLTNRTELRRRFLRLTALNVASNLTVPVASLVDTAMLGHLDEVRFLAGVALASIIFDYLFWAFGFLRMGTTGMVAMAHGRGEDEEAARVFLRSLAVGLCIGVLALLLAPVIREGAFALLAGSEASEAVGRVYFGARIWGAPAVFANLALAGYFIGVGRSASALAMAFAQNLGNAALNVWFIWGLGLEAYGAGLASMTSQYLAVLVGAGAMVRTQPVWPSTLRALFERRALRSLFDLNRDIFIRTLSMLTVFAVFTNLSALGGEARLAAFAILIRLLTAAAYVVDGAAFALESLIGGVWHSRDYDTVRWLVRYAMQLGLWVAASLVAMLLLGGENAYAVLTEHEEVVTIARRYELFMVATLAFGVVAWIYDGVFIGLTWGARLRQAALWSASAFTPGALYAWSTGSATALWLAFLAFTGARALTLALAWRVALRV